MSTLTKDTQILPSVAEELKKQLQGHLKKLILFGSRARGEASVNSDYDLLLVIDNPSFAIIEEVIDEVAVDFLLQHNVVLSFIYVSEQEFEQQIYDPLLMNVRREGVVVEDFLRTEGFLS